MPGKMAGSDPRPSIRITRGAGSGQHLASVLQERRERTLMPVWDSSGESRLILKLGDSLTHATRATTETAIAKTSDGLMGCGNLALTRSVRA